jgi:ribosomal protein S12 methylthiotransferase accessory factor
VIFNKKRSQYRLAFGADPMFEIALQRCLTEVLQGIPPSSLASNFMIDFNLSEAAFAEPNTRITELFKAIFDGSGRCPPAFFSSKGEPRFGGVFRRQFCGSRAAFQHVAGLVHKLGYPIYIRDVSYLGFPAYQVYVPGLSETVRFGKEAAQMALQEIPFIRGCLLNLKNTTEVDLKRCIHSLEALSNSAIFGSIYKTYQNVSFTKNLTHIALEDSADFWCMHNNFLLALMCHRIGDHKGAYQHLSSFLEKCAGKGNITQSFLWNVPPGLLQA